MKKIFIFQLFFISVLLAAGNPCLCAQPQNLEALRIQRLETLADLWGRIYIFHPSIARSGMNIDWEKVLIEAIPKVENAGTKDEFIAVLNEVLFKPLGDPFVFACSSSRAQTKPKTSPERKMASEVMAGATGYMDACDPRIYDDGNFLNDFYKSFKDVGTVKILIVDLRWRDAPEFRYGAYDFYKYSFLRLFADVSVYGGAELVRVHEGWDETGSSVAYTRKWQTTKGFLFNPVNEPDWIRSQYPRTNFASIKTISTPTIFIVNDSSVLYLRNVLDALQSRPHVAVVLEKTGSSIVSGIPGQPPLLYPEGVAVYLNTRLFVSRDNNLGFNPDYTSEIHIEKDQLPLLADRVFGGKEDAACRSSADPLLKVCFYKAEPVSMQSLSREQRLLGLFKIWNVIKYFFPHLEFADIDWSCALKEWIPAVEDARNLRDYYIVLQKLAARLNDSHISINHPALPEYKYTLPMVMERIEGKAVVTEVLPVKKSAAVKVDVGDEVLKVGEKTIPELEAEWGSVTSVSTRQRLWLLVYRFFSRSEKKGKTELTVRRIKTGKVEKISLDYVPVSNIARRKKNTDPVPLKMLNGNIGYVNLGALVSYESVTDAVEAWNKTGGLILDLRESLGGFASFTIPCLISGPVKTRVFETPVVRTHDEHSASGTLWMKRQFVFTPSSDLHCTKPIVALINAGLQSAREDFCMMLKDAGRVVFVGTGTSGTNGGVANIYLPGGAVMKFTCMRVTYGDGSRFQNIGIVPDVKAEPTIRGIVEGRDEVLEKGIETLMGLMVKEGTYEYPQNYKALVED